MKKYVIINPYPGSSTGIANYIKYFLDKASFLDVVTLDNKEGMARNQFQYYVRDFISRNYGFNDAIIEAPEAFSSTLLLPIHYNVHIRLHCPLAIAQKYDGTFPDQRIFSEEIRCIYKAKTVSSPSRALLQEIEDEYDGSQAFVYCNPMPDINIFNHGFDKEFDLLFLGRFQKLKGITSLVNILRTLPSHYQVGLIGHKLDKIDISGIACNVKIFPEIKNDSKFDFIRKSKCLILPSTFENCSMVLLESIANHVPVAAWAVGGNKEFADNKVIFVKDYGDIDGMKKLITNFVENNSLPDKYFEEVKVKMSNNFLRGLKKVVDHNIVKNF